MLIDWHLPKKPTQLKERYFQKCPANPFDAIKTGRSDLGFSYAQVWTKFALYFSFFPICLFNTDTTLWKIKSKTWKYSKIVLWLYMVYHLVLSPCTTTMWMLTWNYKWKNITSNAKVYTRSRSTAQITAHSSSITGWIKREVWLLASKKTVQTDSRGAAWQKLTTKTQFSLILCWTATEFNYFKKGWKWRKTAVTFYIS